MPHNESSFIVYTLPSDPIGHLGSGLESSIIFSEVTKLIKIMDDYIVTDEENVKKALKNNHELLDSVYSAPYYINTYFLESKNYLTTSEEFDNGKEITITIKNNLPAKKAVEQYVLLLRNWFALQPRKARQQLVLHEETI